MNAIELEKKQIYTWLNKQIKAYRLQHSLVNDSPKYEFVCIAGTYSEKEIHITGLLKITEALGIVPTIVEWDGNASCNTNHLEGSFFYRGFRFFQLLDPEEVVDVVDFIEEDK